MVPHRRGAGGAQRQTPRSAPHGPGHRALARHRGQPRLPGRPLPAQGRQPRRRPHEGQHHRVPVPRLPLRSRRRLPGDPRHGVRRPHPRVPARAHLPGPGTVRAGVDVVGRRASRGRPAAGPGPGRGDGQPEALRHQALDPSGALHPLHREPARVLPRDLRAPGPLVQLHRLPAPVRHTEQVRARRPRALPGRHPDHQPPGGDGGGGADHPLLLRPLPGGRPHQHHPLRHHVHLPVHGARADRAVRDHLLAGPDRRREHGTHPALVRVRTGQAGPADRTAAPTAALGVPLHGKVGPGPPGRTDHGAPGAQDQCRRREQVHPRRRDERQVHLDARQAARGSRRTPGTGTGPGTGRGRGPRRPGNRHPRRTRRRATARRPAPRRAAGGPAARGAAPSPRRTPPRARRPEDGGRTRESESERCTADTTRRPVPRRW